VKGQEVILKKGDTLTIDGSTGIVYFGEIATVIAGIFFLIFILAFVDLFFLARDENYQTVLKWADKYKRMQVLVNAENVGDVKSGIEFGAEGVGLCRTEHMFFQKERLDLFRQMILSDSFEQRCQILVKMLPLQQEDFKEIFKTVQNRFVCIPYCNFLFLIFYIDK
jgi:pyruvate,orthophosphate dikinase